MPKKKQRDNYSISARTKLIGFIDELLDSGEAPDLKGRDRSRAVDMLLEEALIARFGEKRVIKEIC